MTTARPDIAIDPYRRGRRAVWWIALGVYVLALSLRLAVLMEIKDHPTIAQCKVLDMRGNHEFALAILDGLRPTTFYKAPFYTYFLAGVYAVAGADPLNARVVQIVLVSFVPVLALLIARHFFGLLVGTISGLLTAVFWTFLYFSVELLDTELACLIYLLLAYLLLVLNDERGTKWLLCGVLLGWGAVTRPNILAFAPVLAIAVLVIGWRRQRRRPEQSDGESPSDGRRPWLKPVSHAAALTVGCCVAVAPVTLHNRLVGGEWVLIGAYAGMNLYVANCPDSDSKDGPLLIDDASFPESKTYDPNEPWARCCLNYYTAQRVAEAKLGRCPTPGEFSNIMGQMAIDFLREHPGWLVRHGIRRLCWLFNTHEFHSNRDFYHFRRWSWVLWSASGLQFGMICPLAIVGLALALSRRELRTPAMAYYVAMLASLSLPAVLFIINARFRLPMVHLLIPFAGYGLVQAIGLCRSGVAWRRRLKVGIPLAGLAVFCNMNLFDYWSSGKAHLRWAMVMACEKTGREDLLPQAVREFEEALAEELPHLRPSNTSLVLKYANPMTWLFRYYDRRGDRTKALDYARRMLPKEQFDPDAVHRAFDLFLEAGDRDAASQAIEKMAPWTEPDVRADFLVRLGERFNDRGALRRAVDLYQLAVALHPAEYRHRKRLDELQQRLKTARDATTVPASSPATTIRANP